MAKTYLSTVKYMIKTNFTVEGIVDKHDIIGAIFGQSEGLIGEEMDLKELQKNGKLGRIEVETETKSGKTLGTITVPSSLDKVQTSILAAAVESVDKVGPCNSEFKTKSIEDARQEKRKAVTERAKELLLKMSEGMPETQELTESIREKARTSDLKEIGPDKVAIGPEAETSTELILVEGRADVINLLKHGIKNVAGVGGAKIPKTIIDLAKGKEITLFVDGDRGGDIIARQLSRAIDVATVAKAPDGKEVEELTLKEILSALRKKVGTGEMAEPRRGTYARPTRDRPSYGENSYRPRSNYRSDGPRRNYDNGPRRSYSERPRPRAGSYSERGPGRNCGEGPRTTSYGERPRSNFDRERQGRGYATRAREEERARPKAPNELGEFSAPMKELEGSLKARILDDKQKTKKELNVRDLLKEIEKHKGANAIVLDGIITKRLLEEAEKNKIKQLVGVKKGRIEESKEVKVATLY